MLAISFWICVVGVITPYLIYPVWLYALSRLRPVCEATGDLLPVTFVISAYNEADVIAEKIENTLELDYPRELLQIVVISDESDDGTDAIVASLRRSGFDSPVSSSRKIGRHQYVLSISSLVRSLCSAMPMRSIGRMPSRI